MNALARNVGMILGIALSVAVFAAVQNCLNSHGVNARDAFIGGFQAAMLLGTVCAVAGGILSAKR